MAKTDWVKRYESLEEKYFIEVGKVAELEKKLRYEQDLKITSYNRYDREVSRFRRVIEALEGSIVMYRQIALKCQDLLTRLGFTFEPGKMVKEDEVNLAG